MKDVHMLRAYVFTIAAFLPSFAYAFDGNHLLKMCREGEVGDGYFQQGYCIGYTASIADVLRQDLINGYSACVPSDATYGQISDVVLKYLNDNPQMRHYTAPGLAAIALSEAFPC
jgi:hypothetical protein